MTHIIYPVWYITVYYYWSGASVWIKLELQSVKIVSSLHKISRTAKFNLEIRRNRLKLNTLNAFAIWSRFIWNWLFRNIWISDQVHPGWWALIKFCLILTVISCKMTSSLTQLYDRASIRDRLSLLTPKVWPIGQKFRFRLFSGPINFLKKYAPFSLEALRDMIRYCKPSDLKFRIKRCVLNIWICFCISFRYSADAIITK